MNSDNLSSALNRPRGRDLSVLDLIRTAEEIRATRGIGEVLSLYETWVSHNADNQLLYAVLFNHSVVLTDSGDLNAARDCLERALLLNPDFMPAYINLGRIHERLGDAGRAVLQWSSLVDRLVAVDGNAITHKAAALNQIARVLEENQQDESAEAMLRQTLDIDRDQREAMQHYLALRQRQCKWPVVQPWERVGREALLSGMSPLSMAAYADDPMLQLAAAWNYNLRDVGAPGEGLITSHWAAREGRRGGRLRIGYLSSDLRDHAVGYLTAEVFGLHNRDAVEVFAYYCGPALGGPLQERIKATVDHWVPISDLDDATAARRIADDGIQILVDVNGYTRDGRTKLLALRPAPVIVNWLGFPGTMGSPYHHYIIADDWIIPPGDEIYYSEKVLRLPCYQPNDRQRVVAPQSPSRTDVGLPEDGMVYCCFNGLHKLTRPTFEQWLTVLDRVPGSVLWLLAGEAAVHERLRSFAALRGIAPERLIFAEKMANAHHLARYPLADLFLDTMPYGAHTTASDALWMGVPMLTLSGRSFASRVCGSLLRSAGLPELVCTSPDEYVGRAVALGRDRAVLRSYRERLSAQRDRCTLFDTPLLVRKLEELFGQMWSDCENGLLPRPDLTNLDAYLEVGTRHHPDEVGVRSDKEYRAWWTGLLARRHAFRPIAPDGRLWTQAGPETA
ncbi:O-linked N-acetylglucosamine transferase [Azospirillum soli]|uniref:O-linked N-acetylglucosamine transferase, SPINDLY family protein n=1 Tax=Azospirillum soli TaxID=1304799 RepID=UPI001AE2805E|nr:O-linked N-acetylglucosamine transferase [Azospirillum soli]MBP2316271.1 putative O-linked N-acetylglucosamine transferase (SPINDLY family) [Azospirillum soli]